MERSQDRYSRAEVECIGSQAAPVCPSDAALDTVAGLLVELVKADFLALRGGWEQSNWAGNEGQLEIALPVGTRRHDVLRY